MDNPSDELQKIKAAVRETFPRFGVNKQREIIRLLYEIRKKQGGHPLELIKNIPLEKSCFKNIKQKLLKVRFSAFNPQELNARVSLPKLELNPEFKVKNNQQQLLSPMRVYIERAVENSPLCQRVLARYPDADVQLIDNYKLFYQNRQFTLQNYNQRREAVFIVNEKFEFITDCPCTMDAVGCGYKVLNLGYGCGFDCMYCFLQAYTNAPGIVFPANIEDFLDRVALVKKEIRIGSGQFTDSLIYDDITKYSSDIVEFLNDHPNVIFEFKTKSDNIRNLLSCKPPSNAVIAWSLNPKNIIETTEYLTAPLQQRIKAAADCARHGYSVAFHFDPIFYYPDWEQDYEHVVELIFKNINAEKILWISLGCMRMTVDQKLCIENRFPENSILYEDFFVGFDGKLRYPPARRQKIYEHMHKSIHSHSPTTPVYLCMESVDIYKRCQIKGFLA